MSWSLVAISEVADAFNGKTPSKTEQRCTGYPILKIKDVNEHGFFKDRFESFVDENFYKNNYNKKIQLFDTLILNAAHNSDYVGSKKYCAENSVIGAIPTGEWLIVRAKKNKLDAKYTYYWLSSSKVNYLLKRLVKGIHLYPKDVANLKIPFPPLEEQKRIATILDKADTIRRKRQQTIQLANQFLRSVFLEMFGDPVTNPKGWKTGLLKKAITHANNGLSRRRKIEENEGDIVLRLQDIHYDGIRFHKELNRIKLDDQEKQRYLVDIDDILFIRVNGNPEYVGRSAVFHGYKEDVFHNDHLIRLKLDPSIYLSDFLVYCLNYRGGRKIISSQIKTSAGQHTISQGGIEQLRFYTPPIELQKKFVRVMKSTLSIPYKVNTADDLFNSLNQRAFTGNL